MKGILVAVILILLLAVVGWVSFGRSDSGASISINTERMKADTQKVAEEVEEVANEAVDGVQETVREAEEEIDHRDEADEPLPQPAP